MTLQKQGFAITAFVLAAAGAVLSGCKGADTPQTLADQKSAVAGAPAPPGAMKAISDAQAAQGMQSKMAQDHAKSGQEAAQAAASAKGK